MKLGCNKLRILILASIAFLWVGPGLGQGAIRGSYLYNLSNFTGTISFGWPRVFIDQERNETYVV